MRDPHAIACGFRAYQTSRSRAMRADAGENTMIDTQPEIKTAMAEPATEHPSALPANGSLETLEGHIHECLTLARGIGAEGLAEVVRSLRRARIEVIGMLVG